MILPADIEIIISKLFTTDSETSEVRNLITTLWTIPLNVGPEQLARSILVLSDGRISEVRNYFSSNFLGDPRDVVINAEQKIGGPGHFLTKPIILPDFNDPPSELDGATVFTWAWSGQNPFGYMGGMNDPHSEAIYGLAICSYDGGKTFYRFSCDIQWQVVQDSFYDSIENAIDHLPEQYKNVAANWQMR